MNFLSNIFSALSFLYSSFFCMNPYQNLNQTFDFIIVGGGSAGSVLASRLSENPAVKVLLLEAGACPPFAQALPAGIPTDPHPDILWHYQVVPQTNAFLSYINQQPSYQGGKVLGGGSTINGMKYSRGNHHDYDHWKSLGNEGWGWKDVLPYFLRAEGNQIPNEEIDTKYHNSSGPLKVSYSPYTTPVLPVFLQSAVENGYPIVDVDGATQTGVTQTVFTMLNGARWSTYTAYLRPALFRSNLVILTNAFVSKVLFDTKNRAIGVQYVQNNQNRSAFASREVILSAGTLGSPKILLLSGIGNATQLKYLNIPVLVNLPGVGQNLQDHVTCPAITWILKCSNCTYNMTTATSPGNFLRWLFYREGPETLLKGNDALAYINTKYANKNGKQPDVQLHEMSLNLNDGTINQFNLYANVVDTYFKPFANEPMVTIFSINMRPLSRGYLALNSSNPYDAPIIDFKYLSVEQDVKVIVEGIKESIKFINASAFKVFQPQLNPVVYPGCEQEVQYSDAYWECVVRHFTNVYYHPVGTCKMGQGSDAMAVVNSQLQVYHVKGLRVVDGSIMPQIVSGNTNAPIIMIGEKISDVIKRQYNI